MPHRTPRYPVERVGLVFSGGPAPAANAVISAATLSFLQHGIEVVGFFHGFSNLQCYHPVTNRLVPERHYRVLEHPDVYGIRNTRGILIGTSRANPGKGIRGAADLQDPERTARLRNVYNALVDMRVDALVTIGGDDTLKTANYLATWQRLLPEDAPRVRVVHVPKTIDNDYHGIDFTFGFFTAADFMAREVQNLRADARATSSWFIVETMGRKAGWLAYAVAIAGEADLVLAVEDVSDDLVAADGGTRILDMGALAQRIVAVMEAREREYDKHYGVVVLAEGLAELLPLDALQGVSRDDHGHITLSQLDFAKFAADRVARAYEERTGRRKKVKGLQLGYESRCSLPHAFDVMLGSQLGIGAYRALCEEGLDAHMVSVEGQLDLCYVPFSELVDAETLVTRVRYIEPGSDFHRLARFLEARARHAGWSPGPRPEENGSGAA